MCTVILFHKVIDSHPLVIAGNRDEFLNRPSTPPHVWPVKGPGGRTNVFAGRDEQAGGTWFGVNEYGTCSGVTNIATGSRDPARTSRGDLVLKCLGQPSTAQALDVLREENTESYNPFNLFCCCGQSLFLMANAPSRSISSPVSPGVHVLTNRPYCDTAGAKKQRILGHLAELPRDMPSLEKLLTGVLAEHSDPPDLDAVCVHLPGYGTVSSYIFAAGASPDTCRFLYADGPPCTHPYEDRSAEVIQMIR